METLGNNLVAKSGKKVANNFYCEKCDYTCSKVYNWKKHLDTAKHTQETNGSILETESGKKGQIIQIGNAVPPPLIKAIVEHVINK